MPADTRVRLSTRIAPKIFALLLLASAVLAAGVTGAAQLTLNWTDNSGGTASFKIERKTGMTGTYAQIGTAGAGVTTYSDSTAVAGTTYCYRLRASNSAGDSDYSNEACGSSATGLAVTVAKAGTGSGTVASTPPGINCGSDCFESYLDGTVITLTATPSSGSIFTGWTTGCSGTAPCIVTGNAAVIVTAAFATAPASDTTAPTRPTRLSAAAVSSSQINLSWNASTDSVGVTGYRLERCQGTNCSNFVQVATPAGTTHSDTGLAASTRYQYRVRATDAAGNLSTYSRTAGATTLASSGGGGSPGGGTSCPCTLWPTSATPAILADPDTNAVELGVKFRADVNGSITGIRFFKSTANTGTHVGHLWTAGGQLLASVTFSGETASGWQQANFASPVAIAANTTYIASYHSPNGRYSANNPYFGSARDNAPLHAPSSSTSGGNGVYRYGPSGGFPNQTYRASNYWVDVVFTP